MITEGGGRGVKNTPNHNYVICERSQSIRWNGNVSFLSRRISNLCKDPTVRDQQGRVKLTAKVSSRTPVRKSTQFENRISVHGVISNPMYRVSRESTIGQKAGKLLNSLTPQSIHDKPKT